MILNRIKEYIDFKGITIAAFERSIGMSNASFGKSLKNKGAIGTDKLENILFVYKDLSPEWLLTGKGNMLRDREPTDSASPIVSYNPKAAQPYYDVDFLGGFNEIFNSQISLPEHNIIVPGFERATLWCNVTGHSMEPQINHGDIIALRQCTINDIQYGEMYAVVLDTIRTIKILRRGSTKDFFRYVPINPNFDEQEFEVSRIINVFEVIGSISKFF